MIKRREFLSALGAAGLYAKATARQRSLAAPTTLVLTNHAGVEWALARTPQGWVLGTLSLHGKPIEQEGANGLLRLRNTGTGEIRPLQAKHARRIDPQSAQFSGIDDVDGAVLSWSVLIALSVDLPAVTFTAQWTVNKEIQGWEPCLQYHESFANQWRVQSYPWAGNSDEVSITPLRYCGVPGALVYRPDLQVVLLFAIASGCDYLNPTSWSGKTGFYFANGRTAPQFRVGEGVLAAGVKYEMPLQIVLSDAGGFVGAMTEIVPAWIRLNHYQVDNGLLVRGPQEAFQITVAGRRQMPSWKPGIGYEHHRGAPFVYVANNPYIAYFEYRLFQITGDPLWRGRAFDQIDFALQGQQPTGVFHTSWYFREENRPGGAKAAGFCSWDWNHNGFKVDLNAWMVRYILQTWQAVKEKEGVDRQDWYAAALRSLEWVLAQQNPDGGFPQVVEIGSGKRSQSVVCGRTLVALPMIAKIAGDHRALQASKRQEEFIRENVEGRFWYTGQHPDLPPGDFEEDSVFNVVEYWLNEFERTKEKAALDHATANAYFALLCWCPKQLSWVKNPTQGAFSEQQHYNQYSVYCYQNRKLQCLDRLHRATGNPLFEQLKNRLLQLNFFTQVTEGPYQGSVTEAIADPWLERNHGFEWRGAPYTSELVADLMLQLMDMGLVKKA